MRQKYKLLFKRTWPFLLGFILIALSTMLGLKYMMGTRAFISGVNLWARNRNVISFQLLRYLNTNEQDALNLYTEALKKQENFSQARVLMMTARNDAPKISMLLSEVGLSQSDINNGLWLLGNLHSNSLFKSLFSIWERADLYVLELQDVYKNIKSYAALEIGSQEKLVNYNNTISYINTELQLLEVAFSETVNLATYSMYYILIFFDLGLFLIVFFSITLLTNASLVKQEQLSNKHAAERYEALTTLAAVTDAVIVTDDKGLITYMNEAAKNICQFDFQKQIAIPDVCKLIHLVDTISGKSIPCFFKQLLEENTTLVQNETTHSLLRSDGSALPVSWMATLIRNENKITGTVFVMHDISREKQLIERLSWLAMHDSLTSLFNRHAFEGKLTQALKTIRDNSEERRKVGGHILIFVDLDQFKVINDTYGHAAGDELLCLIGEKVRNVLRTDDILARMGGDEFGIILHNCSPEIGRQRAEDIRRVISTVEFIRGERKFAVSASIGLVHLNKSGETANDALSAADLACYKAKDGGRNRVEVYCPEDIELSVRYGEMTWVTKIKSALKDERFILYSQLIVPLYDDSPPHYEILLRMRSETGDLIPPGMFIPAAERFGLMPSLDCWVLRRTLEHIAVLNAQDSAHCCSIYAINLSGATFCDTDFIGEVIALFNKHNVAFNQVCFEITETHAITNFSKAIDFITRLRSLGCSFALDDFGSGMSSFGYLKNMPVDYLKIDGVLVREIISNPIDLAMVEMVNHLAHAMKTKTIAEYAETPEIVAVLKKSGVDYAQGYAIGYPEPWFPKID